MITLNTSDSSPVCTFKHSVLRQLLLHCVHIFLFQKEKVKLAIISKLAINLLITKVFCYKLAKKNPTLALCLLLNMEYFEVQNSKWVKIWKVQFRKLVIIRVIAIILWKIIHIEFCEFYSNSSVKILLQCTYLWFLFIITKITVLSLQISILYDQFIPCKTSVVSAIIFWK